MKNKFLLIICTLLPFHGVTLSSFFAELFAENHNQFIKYLNNLDLNSYYLKKIPNNEYIVCKDFVNAIRKSFAEINSPLKQIILI